MVPFRPLLAVALVAASGSDAVAQDMPESVPTELAVVMFGGVDGGDIHVGAVPEAVRGRIPLSDVRRIVGAVTSRRATTVVVEVDEGPREAVAAYGDQLEAAGWTVPELPPGLDRGGFQSGWSSAAPRGATGWCSMEHALQVTPVEVRGATYLRLQLMDREQSMCTAAERMRERERERRNATLPSLFPRERMMLRGGGTSMSDASVATQSVIDTDLPVTEVAEHFAGQLAEAGWEALGGADGPDASLRRYRVRNEGGEDWIGVLSVWRIASEQLQAELRMDRVDPPGGRRFPGDRP